MGWLKRFFKVFAVTVILFMGMLYFFQEKLIFHSSVLPPDYTFGFQSEYEELRLEAGDGALLNGLHFKQDNPKGVILYFHGNAGQLDAWGTWAEELSNRFGYDVVIWDYRGYGKSTGKRRQKSMLDDGFLFYDYCKEHFKEDEITVFGRSLGGFFATHVAKDTHPKRLILESSPSSLLEIAKREYPFLPLKQMLKYKFQNDQNIAKINVPTFIIHGTDDRLIPFEHGVKLDKLSIAQTKDFFPIEGGNHNNLSDFETYFQALDGIFR